MALNEGYIMLHRSMLNWEWYKNSTTKDLFIHCLLKANRTDLKFEGETIERGEFVTSLSHLAEETGFSVQQVRSALNRLKSTQELTSRSSSKYTVITIVNYDFYQDANKVSNKRATNDQQASNKRATNDQQASNKRATTNNKDNKDNNKKEKIYKKEKSKKTSLDLDLAQKMMFAEEDKGE